jgi:multicomponent Na+:H+ antiporter subunit D
MYPAPLLALLPYPAPALAPFSLARIAATFELLAFAGLFFAVYAPVLRRQPGITLDTDWFYRAGGPVLYRFADTAGRGLGAFFSDLIARTATALDRFTRHGPSRLASLVVGLFSPLLGKDAERLRQEAARAAATWTIPSGVTLAAALAGLCLILALVV